LNEEIQRIKNTSLQELKLEWDELAKSEGAMTKEMSIKNNALVNMQKQLSET
jgi:hypothetical protein